MAICSRQPVTVRRRSAGDAFFAPTTLRATSFGAIGREGARRLRDPGGGDRRARGAVSTRQPRAALGARARAIEEARRRLGELRAGDDPAAVNGKLSGLAADLESSDSAADGAAARGARRVPRCRSSVSPPGGASSSDGSCRASSAGSRQEAVRRPGSLRPAGLGEPGRSR